IVCINLIYLNIIYYFYHKMTYVMLTKLEFRIVLFRSSVSEQKFKELVAAVQGDDRQKQLMGLSDDASGGVEVVLEVMDLIIKKRQTAVSDLFKKQAAGGSGVTTAQVNKAADDYDASTVD